MVTRKTVSLLIVCYLSFCISSMVWADDPNCLNEAAASQAAMSSIVLPFDPNHYNFMIYDCHGGEDSIVNAMQKIGITTYTTCDASNPVTLSGLNSHDILIVGWDGSSGNKSGLDPNVIDAGITGRVILSGHDSDYHTVNPEPDDVATTFFIQEINYVLNGGGTGMVVCADISRNYSWLPDAWAVRSYTTGGSTITEITQEGRNSGVFDNLAKEDMSGWSTSFHNYFTEWGDGFTVFERGWVRDANSVVTLAATVNPRGFHFEKWDDVNEVDCRGLWETIEYTIAWENTTDETIYDANIIDFLPVGVNYNYVIGVDPFVIDANYFPVGHYYVWELGDLTPGSSGEVKIDVTVNSQSQPGLFLHNVAELYSNGAFVARATEDTDVCCWDTIDPNIIYVDELAFGNDTGVDWQNAYGGPDGLRKALNRARNSICGGPFIIYVAQGTYPPSVNGYVLPDDIKIYGGFETGGCEFEERNPKRYQTILTGLIDGDNIPDVDTIVTMDDETLLDGFTVTRASYDGYGIYGYDADFVLNNCVVEENEAYGVYVEEGNAGLAWCTIRNNGSDGIRHLGEGFELTIENCWIRQSGRYGVTCQNSTPTIINSVVTESAMVQEGRAGIYMVNPSFTPILHNLTVAHNKAVGIARIGSTLPDIQNCIVYHNNENGPQLAGFSADEAAYYSCIQDCNSVNDNISVDPQFVYFDPNNVHIGYNSPCKDSGSLSLSYDDQVDMDSRVRVLGTRVDRGAYEVNPDCESDSNIFDTNHDGLVNLVEFSRFSEAWLAHDPNDPAVSDPNHADYEYYTDPNSPGYITPSALAAWYPGGHTFNYVVVGDSEYEVDLADLVFLLDDAPWLWRACWKDIDSAVIETAQMSSMAMSTFSMEIEEPEVSVDTLVQVIGFIDEVIADEPDNIASIQEMRAILVDQLQAILSED